MVNYQNAKIYKLICSETNKIYIGSTTVSLHRRKSKHKAPCNECTCKDFINPEIYLIENYPCNNKEELHSKEREYIESIDCVNLKIPYRTKKEYQEIYKEYRKNNKENNKKYYKEYYENNKEELKKKAREKYICECGGKYNRSDKSRHLRTKKHQIFTIKNLI